MFHETAFGRGYVENIQIATPHVEKVFGVGASSPVSPFYAAPLTVDEKIRSLEHSKVIAFHRRIPISPTVIVLGVGVVLKRQCQVSFFPRMKLAISCSLHLFLLVVAQPGAADFQLSEFMASNQEGLRDEDDELNDWIEISNDQVDDASIGGWYLTDDLEDLTKWRFPDRVIPGGERLVVFASQKDRSLDDELHTNFKIGASGEYLALVRPDGETIATEFAPSFPPQFEDVSYGFSPDYQEEGFFVNATPGEPNGQPFESGVNVAMLSHDRGLYSEPFQLEMTPAIAGSTIRYSTNGDVPSIFNSLVYNEPITISETTTLRVVSSKSDGPSSRVTTHTYIFPEDVVSQPQMSTSITEHPTWGPMMEESLLSVPTMSVVTREDLTSGVSPEVATSLELIFPDGTEGFQVDCGVEHFGGHTLANSPKKNMRFSFKSQYGPSRLKYDLFGGDAVTSFDQILLRTGSHDNWFWTHPSGRTGIYIRGRWAFDRSLESGQPAPHGRWVQVYINGSYQGLHHLMERPNDAFMASYFGGEKEDYEALVAGTAVDGDGSVWDELVAATDDFERLRKVLDLENYADYMLLQFYGGNDWDWNTFQNWSAASHKLPDPNPAYQFFHWDSDVILRSGPDANVVDRGGPGNLWNDIKAHEEFRVILADRAYRYFFNGGMLTRDRVFEQFEELASRIDKAVIAECARWGAPNRYTPQRWRDSIDNVKDTIISERTGTVIKQMQAAGVYPVTRPPLLSHQGGDVPTPFDLTIGKPSIFSAGTAYFTLDGGDPRLEGGKPNPNAQSTSDNIEITLRESVALKARFLSSHGEWSPLLETFFSVNTRLPGPGDILVSELHFNPNGDDATEFIELFNASDANLNLDGLRFTDGIAFTFPANTVLNASDYLVVARDSVMFAERYENPASPWYSENIRVVGEYTGALNNAGEEIELRNAQHISLLAFRYGDSGSWPSRADGNGSSMELSNPIAISADGTPLNKSLALGSRWRASSEVHGSPGWSGSGPDNRVVINEVLTNSDPDDGDALELVNTTEAVIDLSGWFVSNSADNLKKYRFPDGTMLESSVFFVLDEDDFNRQTNPASVTPFSFDAFGGDNVYLLESDAEGNLLRFVDRVEFGAAAVDESFGRWPDISGRLQPMKQTTLGQPNNSQGNTVRVGPMIISEIHYNPLGDEDDDLEFIEIHYSGPTTENMANWRLRGEADYDFGNETLAAGATLVIVGFDPEVEEAKRNAFLTAYPGAAAAQLRGPWSAGDSGNKLDNGGATIRLLRPGALQTPPGQPSFHPLLTEDSVRYDDELPWATGADGRGFSLNRTDPAIYGDDPTNWRASVPSPGAFGEIPPILSYAAWAESFSLAPGPDSDPHGDVDLDGIINLLEFALVSDPTKPSPEDLPTASLTEIVVDGDAELFLTITYRERTDNPNIRYRARVSSDLINWEIALERIGTVVENGDGSRSVTIKDIQPLRDGFQRFIQLMVEYSEG